MVRGRNGPGRVRSMSAEHVRHVVRPELDQFWVGGDLKPGADHLKAFAVSDRFPARRGPRRSLR